MDTADNLAVWVVTPNGLAVAETIIAARPDTILFYTRRLEGQAATGGKCVDRLGPAVSREFNRFSGHLFIMSTGIVVRTVAPLLIHKTTDPAVVVIDDKGQFVISLLSGHIGGANRLARDVAAIFGATPVITTATDVNRKPAIDVIATEKGLKIENPAAIKTVNMALLLDEPVVVHDPSRWLEDLLPGAVPFSRIEADEAGSVPTAGVFVDDVTADPPPRMLVLRPPSLVAGIGCNRYTPKEEIRDLLFGTLGRFGLAPDSICGIATIDLKSDEAGLVALAADFDVPLTVFSKDELNQVPDVPTPSVMVEKHVGVKSVCEAAAILASRNGQLIVPKQNTRNVTVAIARKDCTSSGSDPAP
ncbi:MAG: cobalamin biosynthesis protein CbiG [Deltaproteobacteria bacterium]|nr:MAG: cobalamin biosynthesis protein CbiG [Deltaproteobacteria bacterium]